MSWEDFSNLALYHPQVGYYQANRERVGRSSTTDFYTSSSLGPLFAKLVIAAIRSIISPSDLRQYTLAEIGAEPDSSLFAPFSQHFAAVKTIRLGSPIQFESPTIAFANELFDAQPFHRLCYIANRGWQTCGVALKNGQLQEVTLEEPPANLKQLISTLPEAPTNQYRLDISLKASDLLQSMVEQNSLHAFLFFDYGNNWQELINDMPQGTARAYVKHRQSNKLLQYPGQQDLTCNVCWDHLADVAQKAGFEKPTWQRQESFFMHRATAEIAAIIGSAKDHFCRDRRTLQEILHPSHFGHRFQAFHAVRRME